MWFYRDDFQLRSSRAESGKTNPVISKATEVVNTVRTPQMENYLTSQMVALTGL